MDTQSTKEPIHGTMPTTTGRPEAAPELLVTRPCTKRSLAAIEPEFVDSNVFDAPAPSSSVLQADHLIMDDGGNLDKDKNKDIHACIDISKSNASDATLSQASPVSSTNAGPVEQQSTKRVRYSFSDDGPQRVTVAELSVLQPVIQPVKKSTVQPINEFAPKPAFQPVIQPDNRREPLGPQLDHHHHHRKSLGLPHKPISLGRTVADLLPSSTNEFALDMDEDASKVLGDPIDSSAGTLAMDIEPISEESDSNRHGPITGRVNSSAAYLEPKKRFACDPSLAQHQKEETTNTSTTSSTAHISIPPPERKRSFSISSSSTFSGGGHSNHLADKKGLKREVKIQLLDDMESQPILEEARRASIDQQREALEQKKGGHDLSSISTSTSTPASTVGLNDDLFLSKSTQPLIKAKEASTFLPTEDPSIHDWDKEELEDEEFESSPSPSTSTAGNTPREESISSFHKRKRRHEHDLRRAAFLNSVPNSDQENSSANNSDIDDDKDDPFLDPERDSAFMSETQEANTHNVHLRLETQREFQDAAGLDLGEGEVGTINEDGRYGGMIEDDDEGEDYWENR
ncbi:hypothetical protein FBU30_003802 [Linnemannia zychae]|nr:hypothetical protein FBU30_003802 [Linnemannia zychae]